jgi:ATP-dependent 26S proteasome regulatory subunit
MGPVQPIPLSRSLWEGSNIDGDSYSFHQIVMHVECAGADIRSVCTEAGMYAIRARRKTVTEKDFLEAVNKVIKGYQKFSATPKYMVYN